MGLTTIEALAVLVVLVILAGMLFPVRIGHHGRSTRIKCVNNLKNVGLAFAIFATDHDDRFPTEVLLTNGVSRSSINALRVYLTLSNELSTPKILYCPDDKKRRPAESFTNLATKNLSYFASLTAQATRPLAFLAGDRNLEMNGVTVPPGLFPLISNSPITWSKTIHKEQGDIAMADGSVQQFTSARLRAGLLDQALGGTETNYLTIP